MRGGHVHSGLHPIHVAHLQEETEGGGKRREEQVRGGRSQARLHAGRNRRRFQEMEDEEGRGRGK